MMNRGGLIDLVGRAAEHIDLNARREPDTMPSAPPQAPERAGKAASAEVFAESAAPLAEPVIVQATTTAPPQDSESPSPKSAPTPLEFNWLHLEREGFLTPENQRSLTAEEFRLIKRPLLRTAFGRDNRTQRNGVSHIAMVTSPAPGDGKTFTAVNLALSIASERDLSVLLIDGDARRMGLSRLLGAAGRKGLIDVLMNPSMSLGDVIVRTDVPNLSVVPAGQIVDAPTEVFASQSMARTMTDIATRYSNRFIIFDAPPALASSEAGVLASHVGQVIMVVQANETSRQALAQAVGLVDACPNVSFVLNRVTMSAGTERFGRYSYEQEGGEQWVGS
ncbi:MAG: AAA family ATPase [Rhodospirillaceae bacterium]